MTDFSGLFTPFPLGRFPLPNRFIFPPMGLEVCHGGVPGPEAAEYCAAGPALLSPRGSISTTLPRGTSRRRAAP